MAEIPMKQRIGSGFRELPGLWQLREGPRILGFLLLVMFALILYCLVYRLDRILETPGRGGFAEWEALASLALLPPFLVWMGRKRPPRPRHGKSQWQLVRERFVLSPQAQIGLFFVALFSMVALLAPYIAPFGPDEIVDAENLKEMAPLEKGYLFGSDSFSRDVFSRVIYGARISLCIGFLAVGLSASLGLFLGLVAGYLGGWADALIMRIVDILLGLPRLVFLLVLMVLFKDAVPGEYRIFLIVGFLGLMGWMGTARLVRGEVLSVKERDFVQAGRALGFGGRRLLFRHIAPNCLAPVIVSATLGIGGTILVDAALSFLGLGVPPPTATWGAMISDGQEFILTSWWMATFPGLAIVIAVTSFNLLGDGLRDALDPKLVSYGKVPSQEEIEASFGEGEARPEGAVP